MSDVVESGGSVDDVVLLLFGICFNFGNNNVQRKEVTEPKSTITPATAIEPRFRLTSDTFLELKFHDGTYTTRIQE